MHMTVAELEKAVQRDQSDRYRHLTLAISDWHLQQLWEFLVITGYKRQVKPLSLNGMEEKSASMLF